MLRSRRWNIADPDPRAGDLARALRTSPVIAQILLNRRLEDPATCQAFLSPKLTQLHPPEAIPGLPRAAERIAAAIRAREKVVIYGDYDVDGITATAILWHAVRLLGGSVEYYIPHRVEEGYGLNSEALRQICDGGAGVVVSVDCGVTAIEPARVARDRGVDLVITDHHEWRTDDSGAPVLPDCYVVAHPRLGGGAPVNPHLCGAGLAFKLAWAVGQQLSGAARVNDSFRDLLLDATVLAALGTIADVVPLVGENRVLARFGLGGLKASRLTGIRALVRSARLDGQEIDSCHVGFRLAPRLNACGRMGHAALAVEMLTTANEQRAMEIATYLEQQNRVRQGTEKRILEQAIEQIESLGLAEDDSRAIVVGGAGWHPGVLGIVASRLVDRYHRPAIVCALEAGHGHGSGRSIPGFHLSRALDACDEFLESHGGHEMAVGLRVLPERFEAFREAFRAHAASVLPVDLLTPELLIDCEAELRQITEGLVQDLRRLGPFGQGNRKPLLWCRSVELAAEPRRVGRNGEHLQFYVRQNGVAMKAIAFRAGAWADDLRRGGAVHLAVEPQINDWSGGRSVELTVRDLQLA